MADRRPGTAAATELLHMSDLSEWRDMFDKYSDAVCRVAVAKKKSELVELDAWLWGDFPRLVRDRSPAYCTKDELFRIMQWKLLRGKNRPALLGLIQQNSEATVRSVSQSAFRSLLSAEGENNKSLKAALTKLAELRVSQFC